MSFKQITAIEQATLTFLKDLSRNNDRDWFTKHRDRYEAAHANMISFADALLERMGKHDRFDTASGRKSLMRIYNDLRFHKHKPPYNPRFGGNLDRAKPALRGGYYYHVEPGWSFISCGFFGPEPADLKLIRSDIAYDPGTWAKLIASKAMRATFEPLAGDQVATVPKGFTKDHPAIDLLRRKQFIFRRRFTDAQVLSKSFLSDVEASFRTVRPWFDHMSAVLTSDANGA
ncbi:MAG: DUF2461 domain-containing protein [Flavobacteriales bacterium]|nr:MAG: DUF2461 domain-containing protein [Flavobacteriales bacterium]